MPRTEKDILNRLYDTYGDTVLSFNQQVIKKTGLVPAKIMLRCRENSFHCIVYSASMKNAKIITQLNASNFDHFRKNNNRVSLYFCFTDPETRRDMAFFVEARIAGINQYKEAGKADLFFVNAEYISRAPDDLIRIIGSYLEEQSVIEKRIEERVVITDEHEKNMGIAPTETFLFCDGKGKKVVLDEISIFSAKVVAGGTVDQYENKLVMLLMKIQGVAEMGEMIGSVARGEEVGKGHGLVSLIITFDQERIPPSYKMWLGEYLDQIRRIKEARLKDAAKAAKAVNKAP